MSTSNSPRIEDLVSVGSRVSWSAVLAGTAIALAIQFLLGILGATVGASLTDRVEADTLRTSAVVWAIAVACVSLFVGGVVTTQMTSGENKVEAVIYGVVMWATVTALVAHGAAAGRDALAGTPSAASSWQLAARNAGVPADQIEQWNAKLAHSRDSTPPETTATSSKIRWVAFGTVWLSMIAAAVGAYVGAGPTFRLAIVPRRSSAAI